MRMTHVLAVATAVLLLAAPTLAAEGRRLRHGRHGPKSKCKIEELVCTAAELLVDTDANGVPDCLDLHCPCAGQPDDDDASSDSGSGSSSDDGIEEWDEHGEFLECMRDAAKNLKHCGLISRSELRDIMAAAGDLRTKDGLKCGEQPEEEDDEDEDEDEEEAEEDEEEEDEDEEDEDEEDEDEEEDDEDEEDEDEEEDED